MQPSHKLGCDRAGQAHRCLIRAQTKRRQEERKEELIVIHKEG